MDANQFQQFLQAFQRNAKEERELLLEQAAKKEAAAKEERDLLLAKAKEEREVLLETIQKLSIQGSVPLQNIEQTLISNLSVRIEVFNYLPEEDLVFQTWYKRYGTLFEEDGKDVSDAARTRLLVQKLGASEFHKFCDSIKPKEPKDLDFAATIKELQALFAPTVSKVVRQYKCLQISQLSGEDKLSYLTRVNAHYESAFESTINLSTLKCLSFVSGLSGSEADARARCLRILDKAYEEKRVPTLEELREECKKCDVFSDEMAILSKSTVACNKVQARAKRPKQSGLQPRNNVPQYRNVDPRHRNTAPQYRQGQNPGKKFNNFRPKNSSTSKHSSFQHIVCYCCGGNHMRPDCPYGNTTCQKCLRVGHLTKLCGKFTNALKANPLNISSISILDASIDQQCPQYTAGLKINGKYLKNLILDTGADETVFSEQTWESFGNPSLSQTNKTLTAFGGTNYELLGSCELQVSFKGAEAVSLSAYITKGSIGSNLVGRPWIRGKAPSELFFGRKLRMPLNLLHPNSTQNSKRSIQNIAPQYSHIANHYTNRMATHFDRHHGAKVKTFNPGAFVYFQANPRVPWKPGVVQSRQGRVGYIVSDHYGTRSYKHANQLKPRFDHLTEAETAIVRDLEQTPRTVNRKRFLPPNLRAPTSPCEPPSPHVPQSPQTPIRAPMQRSPYQLRSQCAQPCRIPPGQNL
ncbi:aspartyl protease domain-containing protein [Ditylenchus destructor]|uniref:Aspartyl protease domain-containing protein n=1 Tax=Ditylenchus destructor TaxID=166010 RepID=A0AAD4MWD2_9BILA|nr:aspartyl protease domain-containing protein [Ditylenchus destructor]